MGGGGNYLDMIKVLLLDLFTGNCALLLSFKYRHWVTMFYEMIIILRIP